MRWVPLGSGVGFSVLQVLSCLLRLWVLLKFVHLHMNVAERPLIENEVIRPLVLGRSQVACFPFRLRVLPVFSSSSSSSFLFPMTRKVHCNSELLFHFGMFVEMAAPFFLHEFEPPFMQEVHRSACATFVESPA